MIKVIFIFALLFSTCAVAQKNLEISLEGYINNFSSKDRIYGATMYMFQNGRMVSKSISDVKGSYFISGAIKTSLSFEIMVSRPGYVTKKVLFDFKELKIQNPNGILQAMEELVIELFEIRAGADLDFVKKTYAEKFTWDPSRNIAIPEEKYKNDIEVEVLNAYKLADQGSKTDRFKRLLSSSLNKNAFSKAITNIDSILHYEPGNESLKVKRSELVTRIEKIKKDQEDRARFDVFRQKGDDAFAKRNYDEAEKYYKDALDIIEDRKVQNLLKNISDLREKENTLIANNQKMISLRRAADSLRKEKSFSESVAKLKAIQILDPTKRSKIQSEIDDIVKEAADFKLSTSIEKYIEIAESQNNSDSLQRALSNYRKAEKLIKKLSDQQLVNRHAKQIENGIAEISLKKSEEVKDFEEWLRKAYSHVLNGPDSYELALRILDSPPMKSRSTDPKVIALKKQITSLDEMYSLKQHSISTFDKDKPGALSEMKKVLKIANANYKLIPQDDFKQIKDSLTSWSGGSDLITSNNNKSAQVSKSKGIVVQSPGELYTGSDVDAFSDLMATIEKRNSEPSIFLQDLENRTDYDNYFNSIIEDVRNETFSNEYQEFLNGIEIDQLELDGLNAELQKNQQSSQQNSEWISQVNAEEVKKIQELSAIQEENSKTEMSNIINTEVLNQVDREKYFSEKENDRYNQNQITKHNNDIQYNERLVQGQNQINALDYEIQMGDSLNNVERTQIDKYLESIDFIEDNYQTSPNFLKDENDSLFPRNQMTERIFKRTNTQGEVTSITIQRVVVDSNGYGVVYEMTSDESGNVFYFRNNANIPEYIWFNESPGTDVVQK